MQDKFLALFSFALFAVFISILGIWVDSMSLKVVLIITVLMCGYDFWLNAFAPKNRGKDNKR